MDGEIMPASGTRVLRRGQRGQNIVEFALVGLVFFLIVMGIFDFGRAILYYNMLSNAAREGARVGIIPNTPKDKICTAVIAHTQLPNAPQIPGACETGDLTVTVLPDGSTVAGQSVQVTVTYGFTPITPLIAAFTGDPLTLSASSTMYVEQ